jgi:N6-adenosine-specific RNA methylase IME4
MLDLPDKKYDVIVVDPPWNIKKLTRKKRPNQINMDYKTMSLETIRELNIQKLAKDSAWIFLWTTQKYLFDAKDVLINWGFKYLVMSVWEKTYGVSAGMPLYGYGWNAEFILVGYCGDKPTLWPKRSLIPLVFQGENIKHSQKPDVFYKNIEVLGNDRIDMFARNKRDGWDVWGDEIE